MEYPWLVYTAAVIVALLLLWGLYRLLKSKSQSQTPDVEQGQANGVHLPSTTELSSGAITHDVPALGEGTSPTPITSEPSTPKPPKPPDSGILKTLKKLIRTGSRTSIRSVNKLRDSLRSETKIGKRTTPRSSVRSSKIGSLRDGEGSLSKRVKPTTIQSGRLVSDWVDEAFSEHRIGYPQSAVTILPAASTVDGSASLPAAVTVARPKRPYRPSLDLHGLSRREARTEIYRFLRRNRNREVEIITGRGLHSYQGRSVLKPLLENILDEKGLYYDTINKGGAYIIDNE